jgi:protein O-mannosyl-transferase
MDQTDSGLGSSGVDKTESVAPVQVASITAESIRARPAAVSIAVLLVYAVGGAIAYAPALNAFFVSDDFYFLDIVSSASGPLVCFKPLLERYIRPLVVGTYYLCFRAFGLWPLPYHVATLTYHVASAWLLFLIACRLFRPHGRALAFAAGLLFLLFGGHSEAVAWTAGIADPILTASLLTSFLFFLRSIEQRASRGWMTASVAALLVAALAKEAWVIFPLILLAYLLTAAGRAGDAWRRGVIAVAIAGGIAIGYLVLRSYTFGSITGGYSGRGSSLHSGQMLAYTRAFVLRCFLPPGSWTTWIPRWLDIAVWPLIVIAVTARLRGDGLRTVLFCGVAVALCLLPVLPFTISVKTTESERYVYLASAFAALLTVVVISEVIRRPALTVTAVAALVAFHTAVLTENVRRWSADGALARRILDTFAEQARVHSAANTGFVFLLNYPDSLHGAYTFRSGFLEALRLFQPAGTNLAQRTVAIALHSLATPQDVFVAAQSGPARFTFDAGANTIKQVHLPDSPWYAIVNQTPHSYEIEFKPLAAGAPVLYLTGGRVEYVGTVP